jgi:hypothetical protein
MRQENQDRSAGRSRVFTFAGNFEQSRDILSNKTGRRGARTMQMCISAVHFRSFIAI